MCIFVVFIDYLFVNLRLTRMGLDSIDDSIERSCRKQVTNTRTALATPHHAAMLPC